MFTDTHGGGMTPLSDKPNIHWPSIFRLGLKYARIREELRLKGQPLSMEPKEQKKQEQDLVDLGRQLEVYRQIIGMDQIWIEKNRIPVRSDYIRDL